MKISVVWALWMGGAAVGIGLFRKPLRCWLGDGGGVVLGCAGA